MDELVFLIPILLINHRIPHILVEIYECRFLGKNERQSYPLIQGAKHCPIKRRHASIAWIGGSTSGTNRPILRRVINRKHKSLRVQYLNQRGRWLEPWPGRPTAHGLHRPSTSTWHSPPELCREAGGSPL